VHYVTNLKQKGIGYEAIEIQQKWSEATKEESLLLSNEGIFGMEENTLRNLIPFFLGNLSNISFIQYLAYY